MIDLTQVGIKKIVTHYVGNKLRNEGVTFFESETIVDEGTTSHLLKYLLLSLKLDGIYNFNHSVELQMNDVYILVSEIFLNKSKFAKHSRSLVKLLYEVSTHPKIKDGEVNVILFSNVLFNDENIEAIGIFKTESKDAFLRMRVQEEIYSIGHEIGVALNKLDKGCLIINVEKETGFRVLLNNSGMGSADSQYWMTDFLKITPYADKFHQTQTFLDMAKNYITEKLTDDFVVEKTEQIEILNRSIDFFKSNLNFNKKEFEKEVLQDSGIIKSFRKYNEAFQEENAFKFEDSFEISAQAVKKQSKIFKSTLKLDKNFHIYIHGDSGLIEKGVENDGRKYYKIYYDKED